MSVAPMHHYRECISELERRLESIALVYAKQRALGETPDMDFHRAARALGLDDADAIDRIRKRVFYRYKVIRRLPSRCIFEEADRIAQLFIAAAGPSHFHTQPSA